MFKKIQKRDSSIVDFDASKITSAINKAGVATGEFGKTEAEKLTGQVLALADKLDLGPLPCVENIQDVVEKVLFCVISSEHLEDPTCLAKSKLRLPKGRSFPLRTSILNIAPLPPRPKGRGITVSVATQFRTIKKALHPQLQRRGIALF